MLNDETTFGLGRAELPLLTQLADSLDLEQLLIAPAPGQIAALRAARWYVPASNEKLRPKEPGYGDPTVLVYTHPDRAEARTGPMIELDGLTDEMGKRNRVLQRINMVFRDTFFGYVIHNFL